LNKLIPLLAFSILLLVPVGVQKAFADVTTFISSDDTYLNSVLTDSNFNGQTTFAAGRSTTVIAHGVVAFDLSSIPPGSTINDVQLKLTADLISNPPIPLLLHKITTNWDESTTTWNFPWTTPGGDFLTTSSATQTITVLDAYIWGSTGQMVNDVQGWVDDPSSNNGWLLKRADESVTGFARFFHNTGNPTDVPMLIVTFNEPTGQPVGGQLIPIETTSLILAGAQTFSWMIPVVLSVLGIGLFVVSRKSE